MQIGVEITHKLAHEPGSYYIKEIIRPKYVTPKREEAGLLGQLNYLIVYCRNVEPMKAYWQRLSHRSLRTIYPFTE